MGMFRSVMASCGSGASTVSTPSRDRDDLMASGLVPFGSKNSLLYSLYTDFVSDFSSCFAWTWKQLENYVSNAATLLVTNQSFVYPDKSSACRVHLNDSERWHDACAFQPILYFVDINKHASFSWIIYLH